jgi:NAD(P)-dependent dehydrogenase (short-subunit alcohol dehydrogenase family)
VASERWSLPGRTVLITGAARGIGAESARRLAQRGANVSLVGLEPEGLQRVAAECGEQRAAWFEADVTDWDALEAAVAGTVERFGGIDVVMANAGIAPAGMVRSIEPAAFEKTIEINLLGAWRTVRVCLPQVVDRRGYVLVVSSMSALLYGPGMASYTASKAGVEAFSNAMRIELAHLGVDVGVGYLFWIGTDMVAGGDAHPAFAFARAKLPGPLGKTHPVSKVGDAVVDGIERRRRWITVPRWIRALLLLRGLLFPLLDLGGGRDAAEMDERFERDKAQRGAEASAPVGAGGAAVRDRLLDRR